MLEGGTIAHRTALAEVLCAQFGFRDVRGRPQRAGCLKALRELERSGHLQLPAAQTPGRRCGAREGAAPVPAAQGVPAQTGAVRDLELILVSDAAQRAIWNGLMAHEHPRGAGPLVGCQLRYLIGSAHGWLGAIGFGAAALKLAARDHWIGWDEAQRRAHLLRVVGLNRFLIRPGVRCRNLASHVLGAVLRRLGEDFERHFGYRPWLVETFVESRVHSGASLKAANWRYVGPSRGRGRQDRHRTGTETPKAIYLYALDRQWRQHLGVGPAPVLAHGPLAPGVGLQGQQWAEQEFGQAPLGDQRLSRRLVMSAKRQAEDPLRAFTGVAREDWAAVKGYYRLIDQPEDSAVTPENILAPHRRQSVRRMQAQATVLCLQDGTDLNFTNHAQSTGLGVMGSNQTGAQSLGLHVHSTLAVSTEGLPLGVLRARFEAPQPKPKTTGKPQRAALAERKSFRWIEGLRDCARLAAELPRTRLVSVMDREADFFDLFLEQRQCPDVEVVVRAQHDRRLHDPSKLFDTLRAAPVHAWLELSIDRQSARPKRSGKPARPARQARTAQVALRYRQVSFASSLPEHAGSEPLTLWVVHAREQSPPAGAKRLEWFLLTSVAIDCSERAREILAWYCLRWRIEDWHRVLKSGCRIERLAHQSAGRLERAIAIRMVIAWRIMLMTLLGRETSDLHPQLMFSDIELKVLNAYPIPRPGPHRDAE